MWAKQRKALQSLYDREPDLELESSIGSFGETNCAALKGSHKPKRTKANQNEGRKDEKRRDETRRDQAAAAKFNLRVFQ